MNQERIVRDFLALFHTRNLDVAALRSMLADDARYQPVVPIAPVRQGADAPMLSVCSIWMHRARLHGGANIGMRSIVPASWT